MQKYDFTAPASGAPQVVNVAGRYIKYVTGNAGGNDTGLIVTPGGKPGSKILLYPGQAVTLPNDGTAGPNAWTLANAVGAASITGTVVVGNGRIDDNTLQGTVSVVDGGKARTLAGSAFSGSFGTGTPAAGNYARGQLWNPPGSGVRLVIESIGLSGNAGAGATNVTPSAAALSTLSGGAWQGVSKNIGVGAAPNGKFYLDLTATSASTGPSLIGLDAAASSVFPFNPKEPYVCTPGTGIVVWSNTAAVPIAPFFEWFEEPNV